MPGGISDYQRRLIGTGLQSPNVFNDSNGTVNINSGIARINQSIYHILSTRIGERFFLPEFGSMLHTLLFEPNDYILEDMLIHYINEALTKWEPRITVLQVVPEVIEHDNHVPITISYKLINTNSVVNYVYPFNREVYELGESDRNEEPSFY